MGTEQVKHIIEEAIAELTERINEVFEDKRGRVIARRYKETLTQLS